MIFSRRSFCAVMALGLMFSATAHAQEWPAKQPIRIVVPYPAGGNADSAARALGETVGAGLKQTFIVNNRPGASSIIGTEVVARAPADGYTIGVVSDSHAINHAMAKLPKAVEALGTKVPYDAVNDFVPVSGVILIPLVLVVNPDVPARSVRELIDVSRNRKGLHFGTMGTGSPWFIHMHQLAEATGAVFIDVPYKGLAPAATDLIGGQTDIMLMPVHYAQQYIGTGKLVPIATLGAQRHPLLPDVPTLVESGYPGLDISNYLFFVAPAGTPQAIVDTLHQEFKNALATPEMKEKLGLSGDPYLAGPAELAARLRRDIDTYGKVIQNTLK
ncbi:Bug family tripartite tricarboxylate transporter substrate binding protein [Parapusillimonas granuli]|uniref:Tripartite tricarboxylate transporter substrate binding protein n=1 Tax=Parapusillimonas granuli TaxID=380911 RepID=A0A853G6L6_9BURK|nr:tripartite tricarboxylate transporter substrate binding protein [Parapusillimonas granuli]MBB5216980.1 tripartite-type tricarboxylate transporter receptor subunit TctC [Parapusillimonas granuli]MEB2400690.1 tripartite tricarboxylate transporter substrate binding protein [Alcaligenaceae bacterium]NYT50256.1 tripartite tricarboxylate transporter substrate binding protein [Parapusillimonas granuli]